MVVWQDISGAHLDVAKDGCESCKVVRFGMTEGMHWAGRLEFVWNSRLEARLLHFLSRAG